MAKWYGITVLVVMLDQITKIWVQSVFTLHESMDTFIPLIRLEYSLNPYAGFSIKLPFIPESWQNATFIILGISISVVLLVWVWRLQRHEKLKALALVLIVGGAIGNIIDRLYLQAVVDFIQIYYEKPLWPTFNVADMAISAGAAVLILDVVLEWRKERKQRAQGA